jgi:hypothetical protein
VKTLKTISSVPSITKNGPIFFPKTPLNVSSSPKKIKKTQTITPSVPSRKRKIKKKFSNNSQMYLQENKRVKCFK